MPVRFVFSAIPTCGRRSVIGGLVDSGGSWGRLISHRGFYPRVRFIFVMHISIEAGRPSRPLILRRSPRRIGGPCGNLVICGGRPFGLPDVSVSQFNSEGIVAHEWGPLFVRVPFVEPSHLRQVKSFVRIEASMN